MLSSMAVCAQELKNPSFEESVDTRLWVSDRAANWERWGAWFNRETTWKPTLDGECVMAYHHWNIKQNEPSVIYQDIRDLPSGKMVKFSIKAFKDKGTNADQIEMRLEPYLGGGTLASNVYRMSDLKSDKWNELWVVGKSSTPGIRVLVVAKPARTDQRKGAIKFDCAAFGGVDENATFRAEPAHSNNVGFSRKR